MCGEDIIALRRDRLCECSSPTAGRDKSIAAGWTDAGEKQTVTFEVRTRGVSGVAGTVRVLSTRGGVVEAPLTLGTPPE